MTEPLFHVIAEGVPIAGTDAATVAQRLQERLKLAPAQAERLLGGTPVIAKRGVAREVAGQYCARLAALGLQVRMEPMPPETEAAACPVEVAPPDSILDSFFDRTTAPLADLRRQRHHMAIVGVSLRLAGINAAYGGIVALGLLMLTGHSISFFYLLTAPPLLFSIPVFLVPWLALLALNILLLRPLLPRRGEQTHRSTVQPHEQPRLFDWLSRLCRLAAVPPPYAVAIGTAISHTAQIATVHVALRRGDYRLTLSLPLLEACTLRDNSALAMALLATQATPASLRCHHLLQAIRGQFADCLAHRDRLGAWLERYPFGRAALAIHNRLLAPIAARLDRLQQRLLRHAVLEADRLYATAAGASRFADLLLLQHKLEAAGRDADALNRSDRADAGLAADLPALIRHYYDHCDADMQQQWRKQWRDIVRRSAIDAPPTPAERLAAVQSLAAAGLLEKTIDTGLLRQRDELAQAVTRTHYTQNGIAFDAERLLSIETLTFAATEDLLQREQMAQYFNQWFRPFRFWRPSEFALISAMPVADAVQQLNVCVNEIRRLTPDRTRLLHEYERLQNQLQELVVGQHVLGQGQPYQFRSIAHDGGALQPYIEDRQAQLTKIMEQLGTQETIMGGRISLALRLCGESQRDAERLHRALSLIGGQEGRLYKLALDVHQLDRLVQRHHLQREMYYDAPIRKLEEKIDGACLVLRERLKEIPYPLDSRYATLDEFIAAQPAMTSTGKSVSLDRARLLLEQIYAFNEALSRSAASFGTVAEEAYSIEPIRLVAGS